MQHLLRYASTLLLLSFFSLGSAGQSLEVGRAAYFEVGTWNIEWFGSADDGPSDEAQQQANVVQLIRESEVDAWGLQEVTDEAAFNSVLAELPNHEGILGTNVCGDLEQRVAFIYDTRVVQVLGTEDITTSSTAYDFACRAPLRVDATLEGFDTALEVTFIVVHMKAFDGSDDWAQRREGSRELKTYIDSNLPDEEVFLIGDFNDELRTSIYAGADSPYQNFRSDSENYSFTTYRMDLYDRYTYCRTDACDSGSTIDHILITNELFDHYVEDSAARLEDALSVFSPYTTSTSDHLPVYARFAWGQAVSTRDPVAESSLNVSPPAPSPFGARTTLRYELETPAPVRIDVFDALGRHVANLTDQVKGAGSHRASFQAEGQPAGMYLIRVRIGDRMRTFPVVHQ